MKVNKSAYVTIVAFGAFVFASALPFCKYDDPIVSYGGVSATCRQITTSPPPGSVPLANCTYQWCNLEWPCSQTKQVMSRIKDIYYHPSISPHLFVGNVTDVAESGWCCNCVMPPVTPL